MENQKISSGFSYKPILDDENELKVFPICVDNFFDNPDLIRDFALSLPKTPSPNGSWPGKRSAPLHEIDNEFHVTLFLKIFSAYYDLKYSNFSWSSCKAYFQQISKYSNNNDNLKNMGWVHRDEGDEVAGIIYLNPNADINSGTSLFKLKSEYENNHLKHAHNPDKHALYNGNRIIEEDYIKSLEKNNNKFDETIRFGNVYNRLIVYGSQEYHRANSFVAGDEDRLTLVFFMNGIKSGTDERTGRFPLSRVRDVDNFDIKLKDRIRYVKQNIKS